MKRLMLLPALALALAACSEAPTAPVASPGAPQFDRLADPNSGLAFVQDEWGEITSTRCAFSSTALREVTCTYDITGAGSRDIYVTSHVEFIWYFYCDAKNSRNSTSGAIYRTSNQSGVFSGDPLTGSLVHTAGAPPAENPCPRKGKPTLSWGIGMRRWFVYADDSVVSGDIYEPQTGWICKSSDGRCD